MLPSANHFRRLAAILAELPDDRLCLFVGEVRAHRRRVLHARRDAALRQVRAEYLSDLGDLPAAIEIDRAVRGGRTIRTDNDQARAVASRRAAVRDRLIELLGSLDGVPRASRIRQIIAAQ